MENKFFDKSHLKISPMLEVVYCFLLSGETGENL